MKLIHKTTDNINGGTCQYYVCESIEEYNTLAEKYKARKERGTRESIHIDTQITCMPTTIVSDGFATYGGKRIKGIGISCGEVVGLRGWNGIYYLKPNTLECEGVKVENWWV